MKLLIRLNSLTTALLLFSLFFFSRPGAAEIDWSEREKQILASLSLSSLQAPPEVPSNRVADSPLAVELGRQLFFDVRLGASRERSCATCHQPHNYFTDGADKTGFRTTLRATPTIVGASYNTWFYADGRRDSLWSQALLPIEAASEMGSTRIAALKLISLEQNYLKMYKAIFPSEALIFRKIESVPGFATPLGNQEQIAAWQRVSADLQLEINNAFANIGKALAAYQRTINPQPSRMDRYIDSVLSGAQSDSLTDSEARGLKLFVNAGKTQCLNCHNGPLFTNGEFHNIGTGNLDGEQPDFGRLFGLHAVQQDPFNCLGNYSDADPSECHALRFLNMDSHQILEGAFKVPSLRGLSATGPYMHDGSMKTIESVVNHYQAGGKANYPNELMPMQLSNDEANDLIRFLSSL